MENQSSNNRSDPPDNNNNVSTPQNDSKSKRPSKNHLTTWSSKGGEKNKFNASPNRSLSLRRKGYWQDLENIEQIDFQDWSSLITKLGVSQDIANECQTCLLEHKESSQILLNKLRNDILDEVQRLKSLHIEKSNFPVSRIPSNPSAPPKPAFHIPEVQTSSSSSSILRRPTFDSSKDFSISSERNHRSLDEIAKWHIAEPSLLFREAIWEYFHDHPGVKVLASSPQKFNLSEFENGEFDAILFTGNCFGFKEQTVMFSEIERVLGGEVFVRLRQYIVDNFLGEAPHHTSFILPIEHRTFKYVVYTAHYAKMNDSYFSTWSALAAITIHNQENIDKPEWIITNFLSKGFWSDNGDMNSAHEMFSAYHNLVESPIEKDYARLASNDGTRILVPRLSIEQRKNLLLSAILNGTLESRGFIDLTRLEFLLKIIQTHQNPSLTTAASRALIKYTFPVEYSKGFQDWLINQSGYLPILFDLASTGEIQVHPEIDLSLIKGMTIVAEGVSGRVYKGTYNGEVVAAKVFNETLPKFTLASFRREVAIMSIMHHPNLIHPYGACTKPGSLAIITQFIPGGDLWTLIRRSSILLTVNQKLNIAFQISNAVAYLHSKGIIHRDLKSLNILVDQDYNSQLIDFGASRMMDKDNFMTGNIGTVHWMAPEIFSGEKYTEKADVYSFGILLWELWTRQQPFDGYQAVTIPNLVVKGERPPIPKDMENDIKKLIQSCWDKKPQKRPSFISIYESLTTFEIKRGSITTPNWKKILDRIIESIKMEASNSNKQQMKSIDSFAESLLNYS